MTVVTDHPLVNGFAPVWATEWGDDQYGPWAAFQIGQARQMLRWIPPGQFMMGSPESDLEEDWTKNECPRHWVQIRHGFWMFDTPVTQKLWEEVVGENPSRFEGSQHPVECISWFDCQHFMATLHARLNGLNLRLPTEAEWEYACRAGSDSIRYGLLDDTAWYDRNSETKTRAVKQKNPNKWGLFDTLGNVWEWCQDVAFRTYTDELAVEPRYETGDRHADRVIRGGSLRYPAQCVRAAYRSCWSPGLPDYHLGFRCLSSPEPS